MMSSVAWLQKSKKRQSFCLGFCHFTRCCSWPATLRTKPTKNKSGKSFTQLFQYLLFSALWKFQPTGEILKYFFIVCSYCSLDSIGAHSTTARNGNLLRAFTTASSSLKEMFSFERQTHDLKYMGRLRKLNSQEKKIGWQQPEAGRGEVLVKGSGYQVSQRHKQIYCATRRLWLITRYHILEYS